MKFRVSILFFSLLNKNLSLKGDRSRPLFVTDVAEREREKRREESSVHALALLVFTVFF
jgi:hypothetical protein